MVKSRQRAWQKRNPKKVKEIKKNWRENNKDKVKKQKERYKEKHPERVKKQNKNWRENNKEKIKQYMKIYLENPDEKWKQMVRLNTLRKYGKAENCFFCNSKNQVEHHHPKPYHLDVFIDLCKDCHKEIHKMEEENGN